MKKIISIFIIICLFMEQPCFSQVAPVYFAPPSSLLTIDKFRPIHLRCLEFDPQKSGAQLLLDKGDVKGLDEAVLRDSTKKLMGYFLTGLTLPNSSFWVNLRSDQESNIIDPYLEKTDIGKVLLEADLNLKKDLAKATSPQTPEGKAYWDKLYKKAEELFRGQEVSLPTYTRPWIVPGEIIVRQANGGGARPSGAYIYKATLKVCLEQDYLKQVAPVFEDSRMKELNDYSSQLIRELVIPKLTRAVNSSKRYAELRQVYYSLVLAQLFKNQAKNGFRFSVLGSGNNNEQSGVKKTTLIDEYVSRINTSDLTGLTSKQPWSKDTYFSQYKQSFQKGEYKESLVIMTPFGQTIRQYTSGGISFGALPALLAPGALSVINGNKPFSSGFNLAAVELDNNGNVVINSLPAALGKGHGDGGAPNDGEIKDPIVNINKDGVSLDAAEQERLAKEFILSHPEIAKAIEPFYFLTEKYGYLPWKQLCDIPDINTELLFLDCMLALKKSFTEEELKAYWPDMVRLGVAAGSSVLFLFNSALPGLKKLFTEEELRAYWPDLLKLGLAVGSFSGEVLYFGLSSLKKYFPGEFKTYWPDLLELGVSLGVVSGKLVYNLFDSGLPGLRSLIHSREDLRRIIKDLEQTVSYCKGKESNIYSCIKLLSSVIEKFPLSWGRIIKPIIYKYGPGAFLYLTEIWHLGEAGAFQTYEDLDFAKELIDKWDTRAFDLFSGFLVPMLKQGVIPAAISKEKDTLNAFLENSPYYVDEVYVAFREHPEKLAEIKARCEFIHQRIIQGDTRLVDRDPLFSAIYVYVFPSSKTRDTYLWLYRQRPDRPQDTEKVPVELRHKSVAVAVGNYILKDPSRPVDTSAWRTIAGVVGEVNKQQEPVMTDREVINLGKDLIKNWQAGRGNLYKQREELFTRLYRYYRVYQEKKLPDSLEKKEDIIAYLEFLEISLDELARACINAYRSDQPEEYNNIVESMFRLKIDNPYARAKGIFQMVTVLRDDPAAAKNKLSDTLEIEYAGLVEELWEKIKDKQSVEEIGKILEAVTFKRSAGNEALAIVRKLQGNEYQRMQIEVKEKYEFVSEIGKRANLKFVVSKRKAHGVAGYNMGVCVAPDEELWNNPDFMNVIIFDDNDRAQGGMHLLVIEDEGKKYLVLPGINPSTRLLTRVSSEAVFDELIEYALEIAKGLGAEAVLIPESQSLYSNRPEIQNVVISKGYATKILSRQHEYSFSPFFYTIQNCLVAKVVESGNSGLGQLDATYGSSKNSKTFTREGGRAPADGKAQTADGGKTAESAAVPDGGKDKIMPQVIKIVSADEIKSRFDAARQAGKNKLLGFLRDKEGKLQPVFSDTVKLLSEREVKGDFIAWLSKFSGWNPLREARIVPLSIVKSRLKQPKIYKADMWEYLPGEVKSIFESGSYLLTGSDVESRYSALMYATSTQYADRQGRTGILLVDGLPIIMDINGNEFFVEIKGLGKPEGGYEGLAGKVTDSGAIREIMNIEDRKNTAAYQKGQSLRGLGNVQINQGQGYLLRLSQGSFRLSYQGNPDIPHVGLRLASSLIGREIGSLLGEGKVMFTHPENFIVVQGGEDISITDYLDMFDISSLPCEVEEDEVSPQGGVLDSLECVKQLNGYAEDREYCYAAFVDGIIAGLAKSCDLSQAQKARIKETKNSRELAGVLWKEVLFKKFFLLRKEKGWVPYRLREQVKGALGEQTVLQRKTGLPIGFLEDMNTVVREFAEENPQSTIAGLFGRYGQDIVRLIKESRANKRLAEELGGILNDPVKCYTLLYYQLQESLLTEVELLQGSLDAAGEEIRPEVEYNLAVAIKKYLMLERMPPLDFLRQVIDDHDFIVSMYMLPYYSGMRDNGGKSAGVYEDWIAEIKQLSPEKINFGIDPGDTGLLNDLSVPSSMSDIYSFWESIEGLRQFKHVITKGGMKEHVEWMFELIKGLERGEEISANHLVSDLGYLIQFRTSGKYLYRSQIITKDDVADVFAGVERFKHKIDQVILADAAYPYPDKEEWRQWSELLGVVIADYKKYTQYYLGSGEISIGLVSLGEGQEGIEVLDGGNRNEDDRPEAERLKEAEEFIEFMDGFFQNRREFKGFNRQEAEADFEKTLKRSWFEDKLGIIIPHVWTSLNRGTGFELEYDGRLYYVFNSRGIFVPTREVLVAEVKEGRMRWLLNDVKGALEVLDSIRQSGYMPVEQAVKETAQAALDVAKQIYQSGARTVVMSGASTLLTYKLLEAAWGNMFVRVPLRIYALSGRENLNYKGERLSFEKSDFAISLSELVREQRKGQPLFYVDSHWELGRKRERIKWITGDALNFAVFSWERENERSDSNLIGSTDPVLQSFIASLASEISQAIMTDAVLNETRLNDLNMPDFEKRLNEREKKYLDMIVEAIQSNRETVFSFIPGIVDGGKTIARDEGDREGALNKQNELIQRIIDKLKPQLADSRYAEKLLKKAKVDFELPFEGRWAIQKVIRKAKAGTVFLYLPTIDIEDGDLPEEAATASIWGKPAVEKLQGKRPYPLAEVPFIKEVIFPDHDVFLVSKSRNGVNATVKLGFLPDGAPVLVKTTLRPFTIDEIRENDDFVRKCLLTKVTEELGFTAAIRGLFKDPSTGAVSLVMDIINGDFPSAAGEFITENVMKDCIEFRKKLSDLNLYLADDLQAIVGRNGRMKFIDNPVVMPDDAVAVAFQDEIFIRIISQVLLAAKKQEVIKGSLRYFREAYPELFPVLLSSLEQNEDYAGHAALKNAIKQMGGIVLTAAKVRADGGKDAADSLNKERSPASPDGKVGGIDSSTKERSLLITDKKLGGIDFRNLPITAQQVPALHPGARTPIQPKVPLTELDKEWSRIEEMVKSGSIPSGERIKEYVLSCCQRGDISADVEKVLGCISEILRLEEDYALACEPGFMQLLSALESDKPAQELQLALGAVSFGPQ